MHQYRCSVTNVAIETTEDVVIDDEETVNGNRTTKEVSKRSCCLTILKTKSQKPTTRSIPRSSMPSPGDQCRQGFPQLWQPNFWVSKQ
ncbi:unnamed protein product [Allacma fusca]|uniref:Uncharacterized protein n=1 Tax=Allacma fusca TaxID=39272 RepID=A0A8J2NL14_9HEXA|nr:unnamed protein product [Allacma fusca]